MISSTTNTAEIIESPAPPLDLTRIIRGGGAFLFASLFGNGINYFFGAYVARALGPEQFGIYIIGLTIMNILLFIVPLGMDVAIVKFISEHLSLGDKSKASNIVFHLFVIAVGLALIFGLIFALIATPLSNAVYKKSELIPVLLSFSVIFILASFNNFLTVTLQAFQVFNTIACLKYLWEPIGKFFLTGLFLGFGFGLHGLLFSLFLTYCVSFLISLRMTQNVTGLGLNSRPSWELSNLFPIFKFSFPLAITNIFGVVAPRLDVLILGYWLRIQDVGFYSASLQTAAILSLVLGSFSQLFSPMVVSVLARENKESLKDMYQAVCRWALTLSLPLFLLIVLFGHEILSLFGKDFSAGRECLIILAFGQIVNAFMGASSVVLLMSGRSKIIMWNTIILDSILIIMDIILVSTVGLSGPAIALSTIMILGGITGVVQVWLIHEVSPFKWNILKPLAAALISGGIGAWLKEVLGLSAMAIVLASYFAALVLFKIERSDYQILKPGISKAKRILQFS